MTNTGERVMVALDMEEFVAKSLVLLAAGLVVGASLPPLPSSRT